jgi:hypothetical protein
MYTKIPGLDPDYSPRSEYLHVGPWFGLLFSSLSHGPDRPSRPPPLADDMDLGSVRFRALKPGTSKL